MPQVCLTRLRANFALTTPIEALRLKPECGAGQAASSEKIEPRRKRNGFRGVRFRMGGHAKNNISWSGGNRHGIEISGGGRREGLAGGLWTVSRLEGAAAAQLE